MAKTSALDYFNKDGKKCEFFLILDKVLEEKNKTTVDDYGIIWNNFINYLTHSDKYMTIKEAQDKFISKYLKSDSIKNGYEKSFFYTLEKDNICSHEELKAAEFIDKKIEEQNIVKRTCKELGITQKELAERLGVNDGTVRQWSSQTKPPEWAIKFMNVLIENKLLNERVTKFSTALNMLDEARV